MYSVYLIPVLDLNLLYDTVILQSLPLEDQSLAGNRNLELSLYSSLEILDCVFFSYINTTFHSLNNTFYIPDIIQGSLFFKYNSEIKLGDQLI